MVILYSHNIFVLRDGQSTVRWDDEMPWFVSQYRLERLVFAMKYSSCCVSKPNSNSLEKPRWCPGKSDNRVGFFIQTEASGKLLLPQVQMRDLREIRSEGKDFRIPIVGCRK